jgi:hypothetical protein
MKKIDENGDNQLSKEEFLAALVQAGGTTPTAFRGTVSASPSRIDRGVDEDERRID